MKFGLYISDILFTVGGTEAYSACIVYALQHIYDNPEITVITEKYRDSEPGGFNIVSRLNSCFGLTIKDTKINLELVSADKTNFIGQEIFAYKLKQISKKYDVFFNVAMNLFTFAAKCNIAVIHFPQYGRTKSAVVKKYPFMYFIAKKYDYNYSCNYNLFIANSQYTEKWFKHIWHVQEKKTVMLYPAVNQVQQPERKKNNSIIVCSRIQKSKNIETLITAFLSNKTIAKTFKLIIAGAVIEETREYVQELKNMIRDYKDSIVLYENPSRNDIENYYSRAKIYWHAKGYLIDEEADPYGLEHFGITTVEAMSAGCVPVVINKGGLKETVDDGVNGFRWDTPEQLIEKTLYLLEYDDERRKMSEFAMEKAKKYSLEHFTRNLGEILKNRIYTPPVMR